MSMLLLLQMLLLSVLLIGIEVEVANVRRGHFVIFAAAAAVVVSVVVFVLGWSFS